MRLNYRNIPKHLRDLHLYWATEEVIPSEIEDLPEEEEMDLFLKWCQTDYAQEDMNEDTKKELQEVLMKN